MSKDSSEGSVSIGLIIGIVVVLVAGAFVYSGNQKTAEENLTATNTQNEVSSAETMDADKMSAETNDQGEALKVDTEVSASADPTIPEIMNKTEVAVASRGTYTDYDQTLLANAEDGDVVLFFHAGWCPSCRGLDKDIKANLENIPSNVTLLQLNYDTETELKKKYGVVRQHTLVQVDANGNKIKTFTGLANTLDQVLAQL